MIAACRRAGVRVVAGDRFVLDRLDLRPGAFGWEGILHHPGGETTQFGFRAGGDAPRPPDHCDGLAIAFLPLVMRRGGRLHVRGSLTRAAVRNLTDYAAAWANWDPHGFGRVVITADELLDRPRAPAGHDAILAWSGGLRSTHTLVRQIDGLAPGGFRVRAAVRVLGLRPAADAPADADGLRVAREAVAAEGVPLLVVQTDAAARQAIDPEIGPLPIVAAALHTLGAGCAAGLHARQWPLRAQLRYPRPGVALPDLLSGDTFAVRADGGAATPPRMLADVSRHPGLVSVLSDCRERDRLSVPCGRCAGCRLLALACAASGARGRQPSPGVSATGIATLPFLDPTVAAAAEGTLEDWGRGAAGWRALLRLRVCVARLAVCGREHWRWACSAAGLIPPWPR